MERLNEEPRLHTVCPEYVQDLENMVISLLNKEIMATLSPENNTPAECRAPRSLRAALIAAFVGSAAVLIAVLLAHRMIMIVLYDSAS